MKKFWTVCFVAFLLFSARVNATCYVGMGFLDAKDNIFVCTKCSGGTCTASVGPGSMAQQGCKRSATTKKYNTFYCLECIDNAEWRSKTAPAQNGCVCKKGYVHDGRYPLYACQRCNVSVTAGTCSACERTASNPNALVYCTEWTCNSGYYKRTSFEAYKENYASSSYCKPCSSITVSNGTCTACAADGSACTSAACSAGYAWNGSGCARLNCAAGQYVNGNSCAACPSGQWSNGGTATSCSPCSSLSVANGTCTTCSASGSCTAVSCSSGYKASGASCVQVTCPAGQYVNGNACAACPSGQWSKGGTATSCSPCSSLSVANGTCTACTTAGSCSEFVCSDGYALKNGSCVVKKCVSGTYEDASGNCRSCSDITVVGGECTSCSYDGSVCESVSCAEGWTNASVTSCTATKVCSAGGFWDEENQSCKRCDTYMIANGGCVECDAKACSKAECDKPNMTFDQSAQKCGVECAADTYLDASFACKACEKGQYAAGGWSAEATSCTACSAIAVEGGTCVECANGECLKASCGDGWRSDESGKKCLKNAANCLDGLTVSADGCCCVK